MSYLQGRKQLDAACFAEAEMLFRQGLDAGDVRCAYGLLAVDAMQARDMTESLARLAQHMETLHAMAESGDAEAAFIMGRCYETGSAVACDPHRAILYYTAAGDAGHGDALFNLGCLYMQMGKPGHRAAASAFERAAASGHLSAQRALAHLRANG